MYQRPFYSGKSTRYYPLLKGPFTNVGCFIVSWKPMMVTAEGIQLKIRLLRKLCTNVVVFYKEMRVLVGLDVCIKYLCLLRKLIVIC